MKINGVSFSWASVFWGVPQGSVLDPLHKFYRTQRDSFISEKNYKIDTLQKKASFCTKSIWMFTNTQSLSIAFVWTAQICMRSINSLHSEIYLYNLLTFENLQRPTRRSDTNLVEQRSFRKNLQKFSIQSLSYENCSIYLVPKDY